MKKQKMNTPGSVVEKTIVQKQATAQQYMEVTQEGGVQSTTQKQEQFRTIEQKSYGVKEDGGSHVERMQQAVKQQQMLQQGRQSSQEKKIYQQQQVRQSSQEQQIQEQVLRQQSFEQQRQQQQGFQTRQQVENTFQQTQQRNATQNQPLRSISNVQRANGSPPVFTQIFRNTRFALGSTATFEGRVSGSPKPSVDWIRNGKPLLNSQKHIMSYESHTGRIVLQINNVNGSDQGEYTCSAKNEFGDAVCTVFIQPELHQNENKRNYTQLHQEKHQMQVQQQQALPFTVESFEYRLLNEVSYRQVITEHEQKQVLKSAPTSPPKMLAPLRNSRLIEGATAVFTAKFTGNPPPSITWFHNGQRLTSSNRVSIVNKTNESTLTLSSIEPTDSGHYTILLENTLGCIVQSAQLLCEREEDEKSLAPQFLQIPSDLEVQELKTVKIQCKVIGKPYPELNWYCNDKIIKNDDNHKIIVNESGNHALLINNVQKKDEGKITCIAKNIHGDDRFSINLIVNENEVLVSPKFIQRFKSTTVHAGDRLELGVRVIGVPDVRIVWQKDNYALNPSNQLNITTTQDTSTLFIPSTSVNDAGWYTVIATNSAGTTSTRARVTVEEDIEPHAPSWRLQLPKPHKKIVPAPPPEPEVVILKHFEQTRPLLKRQFSEPIYDPPIFLSPLQDEEIFEGERAHFEAKIYPVGDQTMRIQWFWNDKPVNHSSRINTVNNFGFVALDMISTTVNDEGVFKCVVTSATGTAESSATLHINVIQEMYQKRKEPELYLEDISRYQKQNVIEKPKVPPKFTKEITSYMEIKEGYNAHFEGRIEPTNDSHLNVEWLKNGKSLISSSRITSMNNFGYVSLNISQIRKDDEGIYTCRIWNQVGQAESVSNLVVKVPEKPKPIKLQNPEFIQSTKIIDDVTESFVAPIFVSPITDQKNLFELGYAHFEARLEPINDSTLFIEWYKDGEPVEAGSRINSFFNFGYVALTIKELRLSDVGKYTCVAKNKIGQSQCSANLEIKIPEKSEKDSKKYISSAYYDLEPKFIQDLKFSKFVREGQSAHFETYINNSKSSITWLKDGKPLNLSNRIKTNVEYGYVSLDVKDVQIEDSGVYTVISKNDAGLEARQSGELIVEKMNQKVKNKESNNFEQEVQKINVKKPIFHKKLNDIVLQEHDHIHFETSVEPSNVNIEWYKDGKPLTIGSRFKTYYDFGYISLDISKVTLQDQGEYKVVARNTSGEAFETSRVFVSPATVIDNTSYNDNALEQIEYLENKQNKVEKKETATYGAPVFTKNLKDVHTTELSNVHLEARLQPLGDDSMQVNWYKNEKPITVGTKFHPSYEFDYVALDILGPYTSDSGIYTCVAKNSSGISQTQCNVNIISSMDVEMGNLYKADGKNQFQMLEDSTRYNKTEILEEQTKSAPKFLSVPNSVNLKEYSRAHFECRLEPINDQNLTVEWFKNGKAITVGSRFVHVHDFGYVAFDINSVIEEDTGTYTCVATNNYGSDKVSCELLCKKGKSIISEKQIDTKILDKNEISKKDIEIMDTTQAPVFTSSMQNISLIEGQRGHFDCRLIPISDPNMQIFWFKDGEELKSGSRFNVTENFGFISLDILNVTEEDKGEYTVVAKNSKGQAINSAKLQVGITKNIESSTLNESSLNKIQRLENKKRATKRPQDSISIPPQFTKPLEDMIKYENQPVHLQARLIPVGDSDLKVSWFRNGLPIESSNRITTIHDFGFVSLNMVYLKEKDSGTYTCVAKNNYGEAVTSCKLIIKKEFEVGEYEGLEKLRMLEDNTKYKRKEDEEIQKKIPPRFVTQLAGPTTLSEGSTTHFEARLEPYPDSDMRISWFKDNKPILVGSRFKPRYDFGFVSMDVLDLIGDDKGEYLCVAKNKFGEDQTKIKIDILPKNNIETSSQHQSSLEKIKSLESPVKKQKLDEKIYMQGPSFIKPLSNVAVSEGSPIHVESTVIPTKDPDMKITWYKNGEPIPIGHKYKTTNDFGYVAMDILYAYPEDSGIYSCKATNKAGEAITTCNFNVASKSNIQSDTLDSERLLKLNALEKIVQLKPIDIALKPEAPVFLTPLKNIDALESAHIHLESNLTPLNDPKLKITWLHNGKPLKTGHRFKQTHDFGYVALDILYAYPDDAGVYMCKAENEVGSAVNTCELKIKGEKVMLTESQHPDSLEKIRKLEEPRAPLQINIVEDNVKPELKAKLTGTQTVFEFGTAHFECKVNTSNVSIEWFKDSTPLQASNRHHLTNEFGYISLDINKCIKEDEGEYSVIVRNKNGEVKDKINMKVIVRDNVEGSAAKDDILKKLNQFDSKQSIQLAEIPITYQKPIFTVPIENLSISEGTDAHFDGKLIPVGDPKMKLEWFKNGKILEDSSRIKKTHDFGYVALDIKQARKDDQGVYMCRAINDNGEAFTSAQLNLKDESPSISTVSQHPGSIPKIKKLEAKKDDEPTEVPATFAKPSITATLTGPAEVWEGHSAHFECRVIPVGDPNLVYEWFLNGVELKHGSRFKTTSDFGYISLDISSCIIEDSGIYMCKVKNLAGEAITSTTMRVKALSGIHSESLHPEALPKILNIESHAPSERPDIPIIQKPPVFTQTPASHDNLPENGIVHLGAFVEPKGDPNLKLQWFKNGEPLEIGSRIKPNFDFGLVTLDIAGLRDSDAGIYTCKAKNLVGEAVTTCSLKIAPTKKVLLDTLNPVALQKIEKLEQPQEVVAAQDLDKYPAPILTHLNDEDILEGTDAHFECTVEPKSDPNLTIVWYKDGKILETGTRFVSKFEFGYISLDIIKCYKCDEGVYSVKAINKASSASTSGTLKTRAIADTSKETSHPKGAKGLEQILETDKALAEKQQRRPSEVIVPFQKPYWNPGLNPEFHLNENEFLQIQGQVEPRNDPKLQIEWFFNGKPLITGTRYKSMFDFGFVSLDLEGASNRDSGVYTCRAWNEYGEAFTSTTVNVTDKSTMITETQHPKGEVGLEKIKKLDKPKESKDKAKKEPLGQPPKFIIPFKSAMLDEGDLGHFEASLIPVGDPEMVITWYKDNIEIQPGARIRTVYSFGMTVIEIDGIKHLDSGIYKCHAKNLFGEDSAEFTIGVKEYTAGQKPRFTRQMIPLEGLQDHESAHFESNLVPVGDPDMVVEWYKDGKPLPLSSRAKTIYDFGFVSLDLSDVNDLDSGEYECRARNKYGSDRVKAFLSCIGGHRGIDYGTLQPDAYAKILELEAFGKEKPEIHEPYKLQPPIFIEHFQPLVLTEGQSAHFEAKVIPIGDPKLKVTWYKNGIELCAGHKYRTFNDFGIVILDVLYCYEEDSGIYECRAVNDLGSDLTKATLKCSSKPSLIFDPQIPVTMMGGLDKIRSLEEEKHKAERQETINTLAPIFISPLKNYEGSEGDSVHMEARLTPVDDPKLKIQWFRNGQPIRESNRYKYFNDFGFVIFEINSFSEHDAGEYTVRAVNDHGEAVSSCKVHLAVKDRKLDTRTKLKTSGLEKIAKLEGLGIGLQNEDDDDEDNKKGEPPKLTKLNDIELPEHSTAHFQCKLSPTNTNTRIEWFHNGRPLNTGSRIKSINDFGVVVLEIAKLLPRDTGIYTCKATNPHGSFTSEGKLLVSNRKNFDFNEARITAVQNLEDNLNRVEEEALEEESQRQPRFLQELNNIDVNEGESIQLSTRIEPVNDPSLRVEWYFNGRPIVASSRIKTVNDFGFVSLDLNSVYLRDTGEYLCRVINKWGFSTNRCKVNVKCKTEQHSAISSKVIEKFSELERGIVSQAEEKELEEGPPRFLKEIQPTQISEGDRLHFETLVEPKRDSNLTVEWFHNGKPLENGSRFQSVYEFGFVSLDIQSVKPEDTGVYECRARNNKGQVLTKANVLIKKSPSIVLQNQLPKGMKSTEALLQMEAAIKKYTSEVFLTAEDLYDAESHQPPRFVNHIQSHEITRENENCKFECQLAPVGDPNMKVEWFKDGKLLVHKNRLTPIYDFGYVALNFNWIYPEDGGVYVCRATNLYGSDSTTATITTVSRPSIVYDSQLPDSMHNTINRIHEIETPRPARPVVEEVKQRQAPLFVSQPEPAEVYEGDWAKFVCRITGFPRPRVLWIVNGKTVMNGTRYKLTYDGMYHLDIPKTRLYDAGEVKVLAKNVVGEAAASTTLSVVNRHDHRKTVLKQTSKDDWNKSTDNETSLEKTLSERKLRPVELRASKAEAKDTEWQKVLRDKKMDEEYFLKLNELESSALMKAQQLKESKKAGPMAKLNPTDIQAQEIKDDAAKKLIEEAARSINKKEVSSVFNKSGFEQIAKKESESEEKVIKEKSAKERGAASVPTGPTLQPKESKTYDKSKVIEVSQQVQKEQQGDTLITRKIKATETTESESKGTTVEKVVKAVPGAQQITGTPPIFSKKLQPVYTSEKSSVQFEVEFTGTPTPTISWFRETYEISNSDDFKILTTPKKSSLIMKEVFIEDSGTFSCIAANPLGQAKSTTNLIVEKAKESGPPNFIKTLKDVKTSPGANIRFEVELSSNEPVKTQWLLRGEPLKPSQRHRFSSFKSTYTLTINNAVESDSGTIEVVGTNSSGETRCEAEILIESKTKPVVEKKSSTQPQSPPVITIPLPAKQEAEDGKSLILKCAFDGSPEPTVTWFRNGKILESSKLIQIYKSESHHYCKISKLFPEDEGVYVAAAKNSQGEVRTTSQLVIKISKPIVELPTLSPLKDITVTEGESATFKCTINGQIGKVQWLREGLLIPESEDFVITTTANSCTLFIKETYEEDSGIFTLRVTNQGGQVETKARLTVEPSDEEEEEEDEE